MEKCIEYRSDANVSRCEPSDRRCAYKFWIYLPWFSSYRYAFQGIMYMFKLKERRKAVSSVDDKLRRIWYKTGEKMHLYFAYCIFTCILLFLCRSLVVIPDQRQFYSQSIYPDRMSGVFVSSQMMSSSVNFEGTSLRSVDEVDRCSGKKVYIYTLPPRYNSDVLRNCENGVVEWLNFCPHLANGGFGQSHANVSVEMSMGEGWYNTDAYMLEVIFHSRMREYNCLTNDSSEADAFFIPYYAGLDALYYLYPKSNHTHASSGGRSKKHGVDLIAWLEENARDIWQRRNGKDHFMVMGRTSWDFIRNTENGGDWGTGISHLPHLSNMTLFLMEKRPSVNNEQAVPYPTSFHPTPRQLQNWITRIRNSNRTYLMGYAGGMRSTMDTSIRNLLLKQCSKSSSCITVDCGKLKCSHNPKPITTAFLQSQFCLQPRGDTPTRRSAFDALIAGCIPVFFHNDSAYSQYTWHLPEDPQSYSVYISEQDVVEGKQIKKILSGHSKQRILQLRQKIVDLIPRLIYANRQFPNESGQSLSPDAFDISIHEILKRIRELKRKSSKGKLSAE